MRAGKPIGPGPTAVRGGIAPAPEASSPGGGYYALYVPLTAEPPLPIQSKW